MRHFNRAVTALAVVLLFAGIAAARQKSESTQNSSRLVPLKVEIVLNEYAGSRKISSLPYTLAVNAAANERLAQSLAASLRINSRVPIRYRGGVTNGFAETNIRCWAQTVSANEYELNVSVEHSSYRKQVADGTTDNNAHEIPLPPITRQFQASSTLLLHIGQTDVSTVATDLVSGHVLRVTVTLHGAKSSS